MPLRASYLADIERPFKCTVDGQVLTGRYRFSAVNADLGTWTEEHGGENGSLLDWIERVVASWDVTDDNDHPLPATRETIEQWKIPTPVLSAVQRAILDDMMPGKLAKRTSKRG